MLKYFYSEYITETSRPKADNKKIQSILERFYTQKLQTQVSDEDLDYDLFIDGEHSEINWLSLMKIVKDKSNASVYHIIFEYDENHKEAQKHITLEVKKEHGSTKIDRVIL